MHEKVTDECAHSKPNSAARQSRKSAHLRGYGVRQEREKEQTHHKPAQAALSLEAKRVNMEQEGSSYGDEE